MGLTGFNRQRRRQLSSDLNIDELLASKLMSFGYSTAKQVRESYGLSFLTKDEQKKLKGSAKKKTEPQVDRSTDEKEYPYHKGGGYYVLSNGEQVQGKQDALAAQSELKKSQ